MLIVAPDERLLHGQVQELHDQVTGSGGGLEHPPEENKDQQRGIIDVQCQSPGSQELGVVIPVRGGAVAVVYDLDR